jgi:hypothetical protein
VFEEKYTLITSIRNERPSRDLNSKDGIARVVLEELQALLQRPAPDNIPKGDKMVRLGKLVV